MLYKFATDKIKMPRSADRRVKLTENDKEKISLLHIQGLSQRAIARAIPCSRKMVKFIIYPALYEHAKALHKERSKDGRYYDRVKNTKAAREHKRYKQTVVKKLGLT